jgi:hypothetical protein
MKLSPPKQITFWIALAVVVLGVLAKIVPVSLPSGAGLGLVVLGFLILAAGNVVEGL